jgi:hypothetical protein
LKPGGLNAILSFRYLMRGGFDNSQLAAEITEDIGAMEGAAIMGRIIGHDVLAIGGD